MKLSNKSAVIFPGQNFKNNELKKVNFNSENAKVVLEKFRKVFNYKFPKKFEILKEVKSKNEISNTILLVSCLNKISKFKRSNKKIKIVSGYSVSQFIAYFFCGVITKRQLIKLVFDRCQIMNEFVNNKLVMVNIIGINHIILNKILKKKKYKNKIFITNYNNEYNFSVGGTKNEIKLFLREKKILEKCHVVYLDVETAWHSKYLKSSSVPFYQYLEKFKFSRKCKYSLIENVQGTDLQKNYSKIVNLSAKHICHPIKWLKFLRFLKKNKISHIYNLSDFSNLDSIINFYFKKKIVVTEL